VLHKGNNKTEGVREHLDMGAEVTGGWKKFDNEGLRNSYS